MSFLSSRYPKEYYVNWIIYDQDFYWQGDIEKKYLLAKWSLLCRPKDQRARYS
jgi:hypothetical protein